MLNFTFAMYYNDAIASACLGLLSIEMAVLFETLPGRLPVVSDCDGVLTLLLPLSVVVRRWMTIGVIVSAAFALTLQ